MIHPKADVHESVLVPESSMVWQFASILEGTIIGPDTVIGSGCWIGKNCKIGKEVRINHGCFLPHNTVIEDHVFVGPNVTFTDDRYPRAGNTGYFAESPVVRQGASIGAGAVILPGVEIGAACMVGAGAVVTRNLQLGDTAWGVPAKAKNGTAGWKPEYPARH